MSLIDDALARARALRDGGALEDAAAALDAVAHLDRARVLPELAPILDALAVVEAGLAFRYIPAGTFLMGDDVGEPDERPAHDVTLPAFWMAEAPLTWADVARILGWPPPPGWPEDHADDELREGFDARIALQYCESLTTAAADWHAHAGMAAHFGAPPREEPAAPLRYDDKPIVAVDHAFAVAVGERAGAQLRLPTEAEWERAARGCFRGAEYPWGDAAPTGRADFDHFGDFRLAGVRAFAPNDYGLFAMAGGVWEWCLDHYDAGFYAAAAAAGGAAPQCVLGDDVADRAHVLRGGSWADDAGALRVSFRSASTHGGSPNIGFRLARVRAPDRR